MTTYLLLKCDVDDIIFSSDEDTLSQQFSKDMQNEFEISLPSELTFFLGLQILQCEEGIFISKTRYIKEMLKRFKMEYYKPVSTPMITSFKLRKDNESNAVDKKLYMSMIVILPYVTYLRLDVVQVFGQDARFQVSHKETHVVAVKTILKYLK